MRRSLTNTSASPFDDATPTRTAAKAGVAARLPGKRQDALLPAAAARSARRALARRLAIAVLASAFLTPAFAADGNKERPDSAASSPGDVAEKQGNLKSLRTQIEALRREMVAAEGSRKESADQLKDAERAISSTQRDLHQLKEQIATLQGKLKDLDGQAKALEQGLTLQQQQLEKLLYRQYLRGNPDALQLFLNGDDPHQLARDLHYLEAIGRARSQLLLEIDTNLQRQKALAADAREQAAQLAAAEDKQREEHAKLLAQRAQRQATLDGLSEQITTQRREIGKLQRDETRLTNLIERLSKIIAAKAAEARREAERREAGSREAGSREAGSRAAGSRAPGKRAPGGGATATGPGTAGNRPPGGTARSPPAQAGSARCRGRQRAAGKRASPPRNPPRNPPRSTAGSAAGSAPGNAARKPAGRRFRRQPGENEGFPAPANQGVGKQSLW
ncbi:MAG: Septal ring factor [Candidatus Accumulibacter regalis]|uniref:Septal ring factor n=1 Tax=Accumulibacter regalis TaxID=522306 RepID=A0A011QIF5_ACCRE|nr:MAG: Septal ring factor [Candidatus Accumulibacter regalis]